MLQIFDQRNNVLLTKYPSHFVEDVLRRTEMATTNYNFVKRVVKGGGTAGGADFLGQQ